MGIEGSIHTERFITMSHYDGPQNSDVASSGHFDGK